MQAVVARMQMGGVNAFLYSRAFRIPARTRYGQAGAAALCLPQCEIRHRLSETTRKRNSARAECHDSPGELSHSKAGLLRRAFDRKESSTPLAVQPVNEGMGW